MFDLRTALLVHIHPFLLFSLRWGTTVLKVLLHAAWRLPSPRRFRNGREPLCTTFLSPSVIHLLLDGLVEICILPLFDLMARLFVVSIGHLVDQTCIAFILPQKALDSFVLYCLLSGLLSLKLWKTLIFLRFFNLYFVHVRTFQHFYDDVEVSAAHHFRILICEGSTRVILQRMQLLPSRTALSQHASWCCPHFRVRSDPVTANFGLQRHRTLACPRRIEQLGIW